MKIFIDTNIYLGFFRSSEERINSLDELEKLIKDKKIELIFPLITQDELRRNIPLVEYFYLCEIDKHLPKAPQFAVILRDKKVSSVLKEIHKEYRKKINQLKEEYLSSVEKIKTRILESLRKEAITKQYDNQLITSAYNRKIIGNPPGNKQKNTSIGDELEWEILLSDFYNDDLTIITNDSDWTNPIDKKSLHPFLTEEWSKKSKMTITLFTSLGEFINNFTKENKVTREEIKEEKRASSFFEIVNLDISSNISPSNLTAGSLSLGSLPSISGTIPLNSGIFDTNYFKNTGSLVIKPKCQRCGKELLENSVTTLCIECLNSYGITS